MNNGDFLSYATVQIQSHGFAIQTGTTHSFRAEIEDFEGGKCLITLLNTKGISISGMEIDKLIWDTRLSQDGVYLMVYKFGKTDEEVLAILQPQILDIMKKRKRMYDALSENAAEMCSVLSSSSSSSIPRVHICK